MPNGRNLKPILEKVYNHESLVGIDLRNLYLSFMDFTGLELRRTDLEGCCLSHAQMDDCDLTDANLSRLKHGADLGALEDAMSFAPEPVLDVSQEIVRQLATAAIHRQTLHIHYYSQYRAEYSERDVDVLVLH